MAGTSDTHNTHHPISELENPPNTNKALTSQKVVVVATSKINRVDSATIVTPKKQQAEQQFSRASMSLNNTIDATSAMDAIVTCSSSGTEDMLDTVDDCVGCVNQIALQQEFEESLPVDVPFTAEKSEYQHHQMDHLGNSSVLALSSEDDTIDKISGGQYVPEIGSLLQSYDSITSSTVGLEEHSATDEIEVNMLNWCGGVFEGK